MRKYIFFTCILLFTGFSFSQQLFKRINISEDLYLLEVSENCFVHVSNSDIPGFGKVASNGLLYIVNNRVYLFDTPATDKQTEHLVKVLEDNLHVNVVLFVPNHWHSDCMGGLKYLQSRHIKSIANNITIETAKEKKLPVPDEGFKDSLFIVTNVSQENGDSNAAYGDYSGEAADSVGCYYFGPAHSLDNIVVYIPSAKVLFAGCMVKETASVSIGNTSDADVREWPNTIKKVMARFPDARVVVPGHGKPGGTELLTHTLDILSNNKK